MLGSFTATFSFATPVTKRIGDGYSGGQACAVTEAGGERLRCVTGVANEKVAVNEPNTITSLEVRVHHNEKLSLIHI